MYPIHKLLSHSSVSSLQSCPRKYELSKIAKRAAQSNINLTYGSVVGIGLAEYFQSRNVGLAKVKMIAAWDLELFTHDVKSNKSLYAAMKAIDILNNSSEINRNYSSCDIAMFDGKPAAELSFSIELPNGYYYRGFVDVVLYDKETNKYVVIECKTTGSTFIQSASYGNSGQAIAYGIVLDLIAKQGGTVANNYSVDYLVFGTKTAQWEILSFVKSKFSRAKWLADLLVYTEVIDLYATLPFFPMNGNSCISFNRECEYYNVCQLPTAQLAPNVPELDWEKELGTWQFHVKYEDLLTNEEGLL